MQPTCKRSPLCEGLAPLASNAMLFMWHKNKVCTKKEGLKEGTPQDLPDVPSSPQLKMLLSPGHRHKTVDVAVQQSLLVEREYLKYV